MWLQLNLGLQLNHKSYCFCRSARGIRKITIVAHILYNQICRYLLGSKAKLKIIWIQERKKIEGLLKPKLKFAIIELMIQIIIPIEFHFFIFCDLETIKLPQLYFSFVENWQYYSNRITLELRIKCTRP